MRIGFIGLGIMGKPMAINLLKAGHELVVSNRSPEPVAELVSHGARGAGTAREVAEQVGLGAARGIAVGGGAGQGAAAVGVLPVVLRQDDRADRQVP